MTTHTYEHMYSHLVFMSAFEKLSRVILKFHALTSDVLGLTNVLSLTEK
jgi:hypothetical protein